MKKLASTLLIATSLCGLSGIVADAKAYTLDDLGLSCTAGVCNTTQSSMYLFADVLTTLVTNYTAFSALAGIVGDPTGAEIGYVSATGWSGTLSLDDGRTSAGTASWEFAGASALGAIVQTPTVSFGRDTRAAPGPVAGAGIPLALALAGFLAWRRRVSLI